MHAPACAQVVGVGAATRDTFWLVDDFPSGEAVLQALAHAVYGGGPVATALCILARLGHPAALIDVCGDDATGDWIMADLRGYGVRQDSMQMIPGATSAQANVLVRKGDGARQIVYFPCSANEPTLNARARVLIQEARLLHLNGRHEHLCTEAIRLNRHSDQLISFDGGAGRYRDSIRDLVESSHIRIVAMDFALRFSGSETLEKAAASLLRGPARVLVITDGVRGSHVWGADRAYFHQPALPANSTVDTTGCGDVYHGAFLHGILEGWSLPECARFASVTASKNVEGLGGRYVCAQLKSLVIG